MAQIKSRSWSKQEDNDLLAILYWLKNNEAEATWNQIADLMKQRNPHSRKTGKQCRERQEIDQQRWANQLDPKIKRSENWTKEENETLFMLHVKLGNRWSQISNNIPGRTDNSVKNHFYSTMRRGMRKINSYIQNVHRQTTLAKTFKNEILNKILTLCQGKNDDKFQFNEVAKNLALQIKNNLIELALQLSDIDEENLSFKQKVFEQIAEFSRNCRKKKMKKSNGNYSDFQLPSSDKPTSKQQEHSNKLENSFPNNLIHKNTSHNNQQIIQNQPQITSTKHINFPSNKIRACKGRRKGQKLAKKEFQKKLQTSSSQGLQTKQNNQTIQLVLQKTNQINSYPIIFPTALENAAHFFQFCQNGVQINQQWMENGVSNKKQFTGLIDSFQNCSKNMENSFKNCQHADEMGKKQQNKESLSNQHVKFEGNQEKVTKTIKIQSQQQQLNFGFNAQHKETSFSLNTLLQNNPNIDFNLGFKFSPLYSPFSLYGAPSGLNFYLSNWPIQQEKLIPTESEEIQDKRDEKSKQNIEKYRKEVVNSGNDSVQQQQK